MSYFHFFILSYLSFNFIHSRKEIKSFWKKFEKMLLVVHPSFLHAKQLLMKLLFESLRTNANLLMGLMPANYIPTLCVNPCLPVFIHFGISIQKQIVSHLDTTRPAALKIWSYPIYNQQDRECKTESFFTSGRGKKIDCFSVYGFCSHCNTMFEAIGNFYHFCPCQELRPFLSQEHFQRGSKKRELDALRRLYIQEKGFKVIEMWESLW